MNEERERLSELARELDLKELAREIGVRIRCVCAGMPDVDFLGLCAQMAKAQRRGEQRTIVFYYPRPWLNPAET